MIIRKEFIYIDGLKHLKCSMCKKVLSISCFYKQCDTYLGYRSCCKQCFKVSNAPVWRKSRIKNKKKIKAYRKKYYDNGFYLWYKNYNQKPEVKYANRIKSNKRRRNLKVISDGTITIKSTKALMKQQNWLCKYCGCSLKTNKYHLDHIIPISKGGLNSINNVQWLCQHCNCTKYNNIYLLTPSKSHIQPGTL